MQSPSAPVSSFDVLTGPDSDRLLAAAAAAATRAVNDSSFGVLVIVVRPDSPDHRVISGGGTGVLRAAVSVAVAAGNDRLWRNAPTGDTVEQPTRALPEVVAAAADADGVRAVHTGCVRRDGTVDALAIWFETWSGVARADERSVVLNVLEQAAAEEADRRAAIASDVVPEPEPAEPARTYDPADTDPLTDLLHADAFERMLLDFEGDEATILMVDIDDFDHIVERYGSDATDQVVREVADRLSASCRRDDLLARVGDHRFAILLGDIDRAAVLHLAKRVLDEVAQPLPSDIGVESVTATGALAHQSGLVDVEELVESAESAVASGQRAGAGRLILAA